MLAAASTGFGDATFVTVKFGPLVPTTVVTVAVLFEEIGSTAEDATDTFPVITVPFVVPLLTFTTSVNVPAVKASMFTFVQTTLPVPPTPGLKQVHPPGAAIETKVVFAGMIATTVALSAALGPLLVTTCVYVMFAPPATGLGEPASVTAISALEPTLAVSVARSLSRFASPPPPTVAVLVTVAGAVGSTLTFSVIGG